MLIGKPDAIPKKIWQKKKDYGKANIRALTGAEIAKRIYYERETTYRKVIAAKNTGITPLELPRLLKSPNMA